MDVLLSPRNARCTRFFANESRYKQGATLRSFYRFQAHAFTVPAHDRGHARLSASSALVVEPGVRRLDQRAVTVFARRTGRARPELECRPGSESDRLGPWGKHQRRVVDSRRIVSGGQAEHGHLALWPD